MIVPRYEHVELPENGSFRCVHNSCPTFAGEHPMHFHPAHELTWIIRSDGTRYVGDSVERYGAGDLVLSGPNLPHCWRDDPDPTGGNPPEWIVAQFDPACLGAGLLDLPEAGGVRRLLEQADRGLAFGGGTVRAVGPMLRDLTGRAGLPRLLGLLGILDVLARAPRTALAAADYLAGNPVDQRLVERLERVQRYIADNLADDISQGAIAAELGMSASAFSKFFRAATGRTFMSLVKLLRINEGCRLLANGNARITQVAFDCGYQSTSHFDGHFVELKGMPPSEYRRRMHALAGASDAAAGRARPGKNTDSDRTSRV